MKIICTLGFSILGIGLIGVRGVRAASGVGEPVKSALTHGSIGIVISTKEGFVLATDGKATISDEEHVSSGRAQRLFPVGNHAACIIAGLIGSEVQSGTRRSRFELSEALGAHLRLADESARASNLDFPPEQLINRVQFALSRIVALASGDTRIKSGVVSEASAVFFGPDGTRQWITANLSVAEREVASGRRSPVVSNASYVRDSENLVTGFGIDVIGENGLAAQMLLANGPTSEPTRDCKSCADTTHLRRRTDWTSSHCKMHSPWPGM